MRSLADARKATAFAAARHRALEEWRVMPDPPDPARNQRKAGDLVGKVLQGWGLENRLREEQLAAAWSSIVGEVNARCSRPVRLKHRILQIAVTDSTIQYVLHGQKVLLLKRLAEKLGAGLITDVKFGPG